jgi:hypothetical protein
MMRRIGIAGIIATALPVLLLAGPASAGTIIGCNGPGCSVSLSSFIHLSGDYSPGTGSAQVPVNVPPPPCLWEPLGDTIAGAHTIISEFGTITQQDSQYDVYGSVQQAKQQLKNGGPPGTWYMLPVNYASGPAGVAACLKLPLFAWVPPGGVPPMPPIPPKILAAFAYNHMVIPQPSLVTNPARKGYVNLGTYVWANWAGQAGTIRQRANPNGTYSVTATLGNQSATVWAQPAPSGFTVQVAGPGTPYSAGCGIDGSKYPVGKPPSGAGPGQAPDCGALWRATTTGATITATVRFNVTWGAGILNGPGPNALPPIPITSRPVTVPVAQIEGLNG